MGGDGAGGTFLMVLDIMREEEEATEMGLLCPTWITSGMEVEDLVPLKYLEIMDLRRIITNLVDASIRKMPHRNQIPVDKSAVATCFHLTMNLPNLNQI